MYSGPSDQKNYLFQDRIVLTPMLYKYPFILRKPYNLRPYFCSWMGGLKMQGPLYNVNDYFSPLILLTWFTLSDWRNSIC